MRLEHASLKVWIWSYEAVVSTSALMQYADGRLWLSDPCQQVCGPGAHKSKPVIMRPGQAMLWSWGQGEPVCCHGAGYQGCDCMRSS